ncbi:MAG: three-Cys-motif partner protein TcmP [bacterium]
MKRWQLDRPNLAKVSNLRKVLWRVKEPEKPWGGPWTEIKLNAFEGYVRAYLKIMKKRKYWKTIYFDGFAGTGSRKSKESLDIENFEITKDEELMYRGAAERVVRMTAPSIFDFYYFIEKSRKNLEQLKSKLRQIPEATGKKLSFRSEDCNKELLKLSKALQTKKYAALIFLDPFGMQVSWESIASLRGTRSDIWILLPTAVIVNRLLDRKGELRAIKRLESFFGLTEEEIRNRFYLKTGQQQLFTADSQEVRKVLDPINKIAALYISRLEEVWKYVTRKPLRLDNRKGSPLFHFVFASNKDKALQIANHIIQKN